MSDFKMPELGEAVTEGTITRWLKKAGESVAEGEALVEVSTDKVDSEIPSPLAGVIGEIVVQEGETVDVGTVIAQISGGESPTSESPRATAPKTEPASHTEPDPITTDAPRRAVLSPLVRRLAAEKHVDLARVSGTGSGGRITRQDVLTSASHGAGSVPKQSESRPTRASSNQSGQFDGGDEVVPLTAMRKLIAAHMVASLRETARAWNTVEVDMSNVGRLRSSASAKFKQKHGYSLTWTPFVARAICQTLLEFPQVNATWNDDGTITRKHYVNLGIAVALENGLIVPVIRHAGTMNLIELSAAIKDLADRARGKKLVPDEVHGGTFTITNPGPFGSVMSVPIINTGQAAILAFDAVVKRPVVVTASDGGDSIGIRQMVFLSLSWDHRIIDGAEAARFLSRLKGVLEEAGFQDELNDFLSGD